MSPSPLKVRSDEMISMSAQRAPCRLKRLLKYLSVHALWKCVSWSTRAWGVNMLTQSPWKSMQIGKILVVEGAAMKWRFQVAC